MRASIARASEMRGGASHAPEPEPTPPALDTATILRRLFSSRLYVGFLGLIGLFFAGVAAMRAAESFIFLSFLRSSFSFSSFFFLFPLSFFLSCPLFSFSNYAYP